MESILDIFLKYGWGGVAGLTILGGIFLIITYLNKKLAGEVHDGMENIATTITSSMSEQNKELVETINATNSKLIDYVITKDAQKDKNHGRRLEGRINITEKVNQKLKEIMLYNNAQRIMVLEFHNSSQNLSGVPFAKYSCNFEWFAPGQISVSTKCQNLPFATISSVVNDLLNEGNDQIVYADITTIADQNPGLYSLLKEIHACSVIYNAMYDSSNNLIGLICLQFNGKIPEHVQFHKLLIQTAEITNILNLRNESVNVD